MHEMLLSRLWDLMRDEGEAIQGYYDVLASLSDDDPEASPIKTTIEQIIGDERDHWEALNLLYKNCSKNQLKTDVTDFAKKAIAQQKARQVLEEARRKEDVKNA